MIFIKNVTIDQIKEREISRILHFTKTKNLSYIFGESKGILSTEVIPRHLKDVNDISRLDKKLNYICCSIEYPNVYYLNRIRNNDKLFKEWVILVINPIVITTSKCLFSPVNAATEHGKYIEEGRIGFSRLFSNTIRTNKKTIHRSNNTLKSCPTDVQAEVLIKDFIPKEYIEAIIVENEIIGEIQKMKLKYLGNDIKVIVSPELFRKENFQRLREGEKIYEYAL